MITAIEKIQKHAKKIASGKHEKVHPGMPAAINEAATVGDGVWQGDLCLEVVSGPPRGYAVTSKPSLQLVPGVTEGAKHCLDSLSGVTVYLPKKWPTSVDDDFLGPCLVLAESRTVMHPTHGPVTISAGHTILCSYQREYDAIQRAERRNAD